MDWFRSIPPEQRAWKYTLTQTLFKYVRIKGCDVRTEHISLSNGWLTLAAGYSWDGMSFIARDTRDSMERSAVHDALYQLGRLGLLPDGWRKTADAVFLRMGLETAKAEPSRIKRVWKMFRARYTWLAVRIGGGMWNRRERAKE